MEILVPTLIPTYGKGPYGPAFSGMMPRPIPYMGGADRREELDRPLTFQGQARGSLVDAAIRASHKESKPPRWEVELLATLEGRASSK